MAETTQQATKEAEPNKAEAPAKPSTPGAKVPGKGMSGLVLQLIRPYKAGLIIVFAAMLVETAMSLAAPWPLKVVIDSVLSGHKLPEWLHWIDDFGLSQSKMG